MSTIFNYHHRPSKSIERKLILDLIREIYSADDLKKCLYVGLGSFFFVDFKMMHKVLGIKTLINIEKNDDEAAKKRFRFNKPFANIKLEWGATTEILPTINFNTKAIVWLDYTDSLQKYMLEDIEIVTTSIQPDSIFMLSINCNLPKYFDRNINQYKVDKFKDDFGDDALFEMEPNMLTGNNLPVLYRRMINEKINQILNQRNAGLPKNSKLVYQQLLLITYKDGAPMFTTGGIFLQQSQLSSFKRKKLNKFSFIRKEDDVFNIHSPVLTSKEIDFLNTALPNQRANFMNKKSINFIPEADRQQYYDNYRYFPSYVEIRD